MQVRVVAPDPAWPGRYEDEAKRLRAALGSLDVSLHHIGSTAISGIFAKPVIDILLVVDALEHLDARVEAVRALGYEAKGEFGIAGRRYFRRDDRSGVRTHQVHAIERGSSGAIRHLAFRDYMNAHAGAAQAYSTLKQQLARASADDMAAYVRGKDAFVKRHETLALEWSERIASDVR